MKILCILFGKYYGYTYLCVHNAVIAKKTPLNLFHFINNKTMSKMQNSRFMD